jgi:hypothetical protein
MQGAKVAHLPFFVYLVVTLLRDVSSMDNAPTIVAGGLCGYVTWFWAITSTIEKTTSLQ